MIIKILIGFALLILFSVGPQLVPVKQDVMDEKAAEYKLAVFAAEMQRVWPKVPDGIKGQFAQNSDPELIEDWLYQFGFNLDLTNYTHKKGFSISNIYSNSYSNPFTNETIDNVESMQISQTTNKGTKIMYIVFPKSGSGKAEIEEY